MKKELNKTKKKLIKIKDIDKLTILKILKTSFKREKRNIKILNNLRTIMIFDSESTRTRISTQIAINEMGGNNIVIFTKETQLRNCEREKEFCRTIEKYSKLILIRTKNKRLLKEFKKTKKSIIINLLDKKEHPCQVLSDLFTIIKEKKTLKKITISWIGRKNNMFRSWFNISKIMKIKFLFYIEGGKKKKYKTTPKKEIFKRSDIIMTDSWSIIGEKMEKKRKKKFFKLRIKYKNIKKNTKIMHCMPINIKEEIDKNIIYSKKSLIMKQAKNKITVMKSIIETLISK